MSLTPKTTNQTILKSFNPNKEYNYKIQLNIFTTTKVGIEKVAVIERFKQESMYGLMTKKWPLVEVGLLVLQRCIPAHKYICLYFLSMLSQKYF